LHWCRRCTRTSWDWWHSGREAPLLLLLLLLPAHLPLPALLLPVHLLLLVVLSLHRAQ
jgi:hypothetical protein